MILKTKGIPSRTIARMADMLSQLSDDDMSDACIVLIGNCTPMEARCFFDGLPKHRPVVYSQDRRIRKIARDTIFAYTVASLKEILPAVSWVSSNLRDPYTISQVNDVL